MLPAQAPRLEHLQVSGTAGGFGHGGRVNLSLRCTGLFGRALPWLAQIQLASHSCLLAVPPDLDFLRVQGLIPDLHPVANFGPASYNCPPNLKQPAASTLRSSSQLALYSYKAHLR